MQRCSAGVLAVVLFWAVAVSGTIASPASGGDYYVDAQVGVDQEGGGSRTSPWRTISFALDHVGMPPAVIHVAAGDYDAALGESFPLVMQPGVCLAGAGIDVTVVDASGFQSGIVFDATVAYGADSIVSGMTVRNAACGIVVTVDLPQVSGPRLEDLAVELCDVAITVGASDGMNVAELTRCRLRLNRIGLQVTAAFAGAALPLVSGTIVDGNSEGGLNLAAYGASVAPVVENVTVAYNTVYGIKDANGNASGIVRNSILYLNGMDLSGIDADRIEYSDISDGTHAGLNGNISADPLLVDAIGGDFRLTGASPCVDTGTAVSGLTQAATSFYGSPRLLDGDLDGVSRHDMGAHEYDNVELVLGGSSKFGSTFTIATQGLAGLDVMLILGTQPGQAYLDPYGYLLILPGGGPWLIMAWGKIPTTVSLDIPDDPALAGFSVFFQALAGHLDQGAANFSNRVELAIE